MEFYDVINKRRSIRQFEDREIPRDVLERILDAGLKAPSSNQQRRWELVTLTNKNIILDLAKFIRPYPCRVQEPKTPQQEMFKIAYPRQRTMIEESACVILPWFKQKYPLSEDKNGYGLMDYGAAWALIENMLLAAMKAFHDAGVRTTCFVSPIFPGITDVEAIIERAKGQCNLIWLENLNLRGSYKAVILDYFYHEQIKKSARKGGDSRA